MTDRKKLEKIKRLADDMYNKMAYLTSDTRPIRKAMDDYHSFIVHEYNKDEQVDKPIDFEQELYKAFGQVKDFTLGMQIAKRFYDMGKNSKDSQEFVSEDLEKAAIKYAQDKYMPVQTSQAFKAGAQWQKEQFEKNRLAACDRQTEKEAEIERDFVMGIVEKEHRQPTFDDAIKYGMRLQKEQMMAKAIDATIGLPYENKDGGYTHLIDVSRPLPVGSNKIAIIFKEDW